MLDRLHQLGYTIAHVSAISFSLLSLALSLFLSPCLPPSLPLSSSLQSRGEGWEGNVHESEGCTDQTSSTTCWAGELQVVGGATKRAVWCVDVARKGKGKEKQRAKQSKQ